MVPVNTNKIVDTFLYETVENLLRGYGFNSTSYLALESDKKHFLHQQVAAVTAYAQFNGVAIAAGEPICHEHLIDAAIDEFMDFAGNNRLKTLFFEVTEPVVPHLAARGFKFLKLGEEPFIELDKFTLKGNKMANVRSSAATARKRGVTVREYVPQEMTSSITNQQLEFISQQWLKTRGLSELSFTLGTLSLDYPGERRYFIAEQEGKAIAFLTYTPVYRRQGVYLDLMRRLDNTPTGTMDLLLSESFELLKASGVKLATLGMSPLSNVRNSAIEQSRLLSWCLHQFSTKGQSFYRFEPMHDFKKKFCPHFWESKYLAYDNLGLKEIDALLKALLRQSLASITWDVLNQPITIKIGNFEF